MRDSARTFFSTIFCVDTALGLKAHASRAQSCLRTFTAKNSAPAAMLKGVAKCKNCVHSCFEKANLIAGWAFSRSGADPSRTCSQSTSNACQQTKPVAEMTKTTRAQEIQQVARLQRVAFPSPTSLRFVPDGRIKMPERKRSSRSGKYRTIVNQLKKV